MGYEAQLWLSHLDRAAQDFLVEPAIYCAGAFADCAQLDDIPAALRTLTPDNRMYITYALSWMGRRILDPLLDQIPRLIAHRALTALRCVLTCVATFGTPATINAIVPLLPERADWKLDSLLMNTIKTIGGETAWNALIPFCAGFPHDAPSEQPMLGRWRSAIYALGELAHPRGYPAFLACLEEASRTEGVRHPLYRPALRGIAPWENPALEPYLIQALQSPWRETVWDGLMAAGCGNHRACSPAIHDLATRFPAPHADDYTADGESLATTRIIVHAHLTNHWPDAAGLLAARPRSTDWLYKKWIGGILTLAPDQAQCLLNEVLANILPPGIEMLLNTVIRHGYRSWLPMLSMPSTPYRVATGQTVMDYYQMLLAENDD